MELLVSNDDGIEAPGIRVLAECMRTLGTVTVVAPDKNRSGASNSLTLDAPIRIKEIEPGQFRVSGTPTDCVHIALTGMLDDDPDIVVSGINAGANLGDDVIYSGTVAAAMEGRFLGLPALAMSLVGEERPMHYETAGEAAIRLVRQLQKDPYRPTPSSMLMFQIARGRIFVALRSPVWVIDIERSLQSGRLIPGVVKCTGSGPQARNRTLDPVQILMPSAGVIYP